MFFKKNGIYSKEMEKSIKDFFKKQYLKKTFWSYLRNYGIVIPSSYKEIYDAIFLNEHSLNGTKINVYFVHESEQIKLADGTNTTFDGSNPDIRFDGGGEVKIINDKLVYRGSDNRLTTIATIRNVKGEQRVYKSPFAKIFLKENTDELVENWAKENGYAVWKEDFGNSYEGGGSAENENEVYIEFLNKEKNFTKDKKSFKTYEDAVKWARENFDKFNPDMIRYYSVGGSTKPNPTEKIKNNDLMNRTDYTAYVVINDFPYTATVRSLNSFKNYLNRKDEKFTPNVFGEITYISDNTSDEWVYELNKLIENKKKEMENKMEIGGELSEVADMLPHSEPNGYNQSYLNIMETVQPIVRWAIWIMAVVGEQKQMSRTILNDSVHKLIKKNGTDIMKYSQFELSTLDSYVSHRDISEQLAETIWGLAIKNGFNGYMSRVLIINSGTGKILNYVNNDFSKVDAVNPSNDENIIATLLNNIQVIDIHSDSLKLLNNYDLGIIINKHNADLSNLKMVCTKLKSNNMLIFVAPMNILYGENPIKNFINEKFDLVQAFCDESTNSCISVLKKM
jgi:hypothetical protein